MRERILLASVVCGLTFGIATFTSVRPDCLTASAAPGTAGEAMAMITLTSGWTFRRVCVSSKARLRSSSLGRTSTSFRSGYFAASCSRMFLIHSFWLAAVREAVMIANEPLPPRSREVC